ncbi:hypothetical protein AAG906_019296 [Vitis piasezkii]
MYLSMFSVSKLILVPKQSNYQFSSIVDDPSTDVESVLEKYGILVKDPFLRYVQELPSIPMVLNWRPFWSSSPVKGDKALVGRTPFHRMIWELFAIALWDRAVLKGLNPKDPDRAAKQAWPFEANSFCLRPPCEVASDEDRPLRVLPVKVAELPSDSFNNERQSNFRSSWFVQLVLLALELGRQEGKELVHSVEV